MYCDITSNCNHVPKKNSCVFHRINDFWILQSYQLRWWIQYNQIWLTSWSVHLPLKHYCRQVFKVEVESLCVPLQRKFSLLGSPPAVKTSILIRKSNSICEKGDGKNRFCFLPGIWSTFIFLDPGFCIVHTSERYNVLPDGPQVSASQISFWSRDSTEHNFWPNCLQSPKILVHMCGPPPKSGGGQNSLGWRALKTPTSETPDFGGHVPPLTLQYLWPRSPPWLGGPGCRPGHSGWS